MLESGRFPRHKVCGEFVSHESLNVLKAVLHAKEHSLIFESPRIAQCRVFIDDKHLGARITPPALSIARFDLDAALWRSCSEAGVEGRDNCAVQAVERDDEDLFSVQSSCGEFQSRAVVNASGRWSSLTRPRSPAQRWIGIKAHFSEFSPPPSVDLYFFKEGYCGVQPVMHAGDSDVVNVCAMVQAGQARTLAEVARFHPKLYERSFAWRPLMQPVTTSQLIFHDPEPVKDRLFQVGDAATFVDPFIGDGISLALRSGVLAAECLAGLFSGDNDLSGSLTLYRRRYQKELAHVFEASSMLRRFLGWPRFLRRPVLNLVASAPAIANRIVGITR